MIRLANSEEYMICANCPGGTPMRKLPYLNGVYMCSQCSGFEYRLPAEWEMSAEQDEDEDEQQYQLENSGE